MPTGPKDGEIPLSRGGCRGAHQQVEGVGFRVRPEARLERLAAALIACDGPGSVSHLGCAGKVVHEPLEHSVAPGSLRQVAAALALLGRFQLRTHLERLTALAGSRMRRVRAAPERPPPAREPPRA